MIFDLCRKITQRDNDIVAESAPAASVPAENPEKSAVERDYGRREWHEYGGTYNEWLLKNQLSLLQGYCNFETSFYSAPVTEGSEDFLNGLLEAQR